MIERRPHPFFRKMSLLILWLPCALAVGTVIEMTRALETCDLQDLTISMEGTTRLIYASNDALPNPDPVYHTTRGTKSIRLNSPQQPWIPPPDSSTFDLRMEDFVVPFDDPVTGSDTTYYCQTFEIVRQGYKSHIIHFEPVFSPPESIEFVHHILIYDCNKLNESWVGKRGHCYSELPDKVQMCNGGTPIAAWAIGGAGTTFPDHVGYPFGQDGDAHVVLMEVHYNNPKMKKFRDASGMRFTYTQKLRPNDAGILSVGHVTDSIFTIPPGQPNYSVDAYCPSECTNTIPAGGINVLSTLLHAHTAGRSISLTQYRGGKEIGTIAKDIHYDFNFQDSETLPKEVKILPGDLLRTTCVYDTSTRTKPTPFFLATTQEMCLTYNLYYPKIPNVLATCEYGNYSNISGYEQFGASAFCFGNNVPNLTIPAQVPLPPSTCERVPPPTTRLAQKLFNDFNASKFKYSAYLDSNQTIKFFWTPDPKFLRFAILAPTTGWLGLGFSPNGAMDHADVSIGWIDANGVPRHLDRYVPTTTRNPAIDLLQDYFDVTIYKGQIDPTNPPADEWPTWKIATVSAGGVTVFLVLVCVVRWCKNRDESKYDPMSD